MWTGIAGLIGKGEGSLLTLLSFEECGIISNSSCHTYDKNYALRFARLSQFNTPILKQVGTGLYMWKSFI